MEMSIIYLPQVSEFIEGFSNDNQIRTKISQMISLLKKNGSYLKPPESKQIGHNLFELRVRTKIQIRIFYTFHLNTIFVLYGYVKKTQKIEPHVLQYVMKLKAKLTNI